VTLPPSEEPRFASHTTQRLAELHINISSVSYAPPPEPARGDDAQAWGLRFFLGRLR